MPRGKQHASVASALMTAATGVSFSVTRIVIFRALRTTLLESMPGEELQTALRCRCRFGTSFQTHRCRASQALCPAHQLEWTVNPGSRSFVPWPYLSLRLQSFPLPFPLALVLHARVQPPGHDSDNPINRGSQPSCFLSLRLDFVIASSTGQES